MQICEGDQVSQLGGVSKIRESAVIKDDRRKGPVFNGESLWIQTSKQ